MGQPDNGVTTIGPSNSTRGDFNDSTQLGFERMLRAGRDIFVLAGEYTFSKSVEISRPGTRITLAKNAVINAAPTGAIGAFSVTEDATEFSLQGGTIRVPTPGADQRVIQVASDDSVIKDTLFEVTGQGSDANPTTLIWGVNPGNLTISGCTFLPNRGIDCININEEAVFPGGTLVQDAPGLLIVGCRFTTDDTTGLNPGANTPVPRECRRGVRITGNGFGTVTQCSFYGLGDETGGFPMDTALMIQRGDNPVGSEFGHWTVTANRFELLSSPQIVRVWGIASIVISDNMFGFMGDNQGAFSIKEKGDFVIGISGQLGGPTVSVFASSSAGVTIVGNDFHNCGSDPTNQEATVIHATSADILNLSGNNVYGLVRCLFFYAEAVTDANLRRVTISRNSIHGGGGTPNDQGMSFENGVDMPSLNQGVNISYNDWSFLTVLVLDQTQEIPGEPPTPTPTLGQILETGNVQLT